MHRLFLILIAVGVALCFGLMTTSCEDDDDTTTVVVTNAAGHADDDANAGDDDDGGAEPSITEGAGTLNPGESDSTAVAVSDAGAVTLAVTSDNGPLRANLIRNGDLVDSDEDTDMDLSGHSAAGDTWTVEIINNAAVVSDFGWRLTVTPD